MSMPACASIIPPLGVVARTARLQAGRANQSLYYIQFNNPQIPPIPSSASSYLIIAGAQALLNLPNGPVHYLSVRQYLIPVSHHVMSR
jgi:hypothetical protein